LVFGQIVFTEEENERFQDSHRFRFALDGGMAYTLGRITTGGQPLIEDYLKKTRYGQRIGGSLQYFTGFSLGLGIQSSVYLSRTEARFYDVDPLGNPVSGFIRDNVTVFFIGPQVSMRIPIKEKMAFYLGFSGGYLNYNNEAAFLNHYTLKANSIAGSLDLSLDLFVYKGMAIGLQGSVLIAAVNKFRYDDGFTRTTVDLGASAFESLSRIEGGIGIRFNQ
jgi:hypothetical protein